MYAGYCKNIEITRKQQTITVAVVDFARHVFSMSFADPFHSMQVCVRHCPPTDITTWQQARDFAIRNGSRLCRYDVDPQDYGNHNWASAVGPCPKLPILKRYNTALMLLSYYVVYMIQCLTISVELLLVTDRAYRQTDIRPQHILC